MWQSVSQGYLLKNVEAFPYIVLLRDLRKPEIFSSSDQKGKRKELTHHLALQRRGRGQRPAPQVLYTTLQRKSKSLYNL